MASSDFDADNHSKPKRKRNKLLMSKVLKQLEFYFSDTNLHKDRFMKERVVTSTGSPTGNPVPISTLMTFNKLKTMGATPEVMKPPSVDASLSRFARYDMSSAMRLF